jgi:hypothetical protein
MQKLIRKLFISFFALAISASVGGSVFAQEKGSNLSFDWPKIPGAKGYQIEFVSGKNKLKFDTKSAKWSGKIPPGRYKFRLRSTDKIGAPGPWSDKIPLTVKMPMVVQTLPKEAKKIRTKSIKKEKIRFEWAKLGNAGIYKIEVINEDDDVVIEKDIKNNFYETTLPVAQNYKWTVYAISAEGDEGAKSSVPRNFEIKGGRLKKPKIAKVDLVDSKDLEWNQPERAEFYDVVLQRKAKNSKKYKNVKKAKDQTGQTLEFDENLPPGQYKLKVKAKAKRFRSSRYTTQKFRFDGTKKSDVKWNDRSGFLIGIEYAPFRRYFNISSEQVEIQVAQTVLNSWRLHIDFQTIGLHNDFGIGLFGQSTSGSLFETDDGGENENGQVPIETNADDFGLQLWDNYRLIGPFGVHGALQIVKRTVFSLYADSLSTFALVENDTLESVFNVGVNTRLSQDSIFVFRFGAAKPFLGTQQTDEFYHVLAMAGLNHWLTAKLVMRYSYDYSKFSFLAEPPNGGDELAFSSSHHTMGFNLGYLF